MERLRIGLIGDIYRAAGLPLRPAAR